MFEHVCVHDIAVVNQPLRQLMVTGAPVIGQYFPDGNNDMHIRLCSHVQGRCQRGKGGFPGQWVITKRRAIMRCSSVNDLARFNNSNLLQLQLRNYLTLCELIRDNRAKLLEDGYCSSVACCLLLCLSVSHNVKWKKIGS